MYFPAGWRFWWRYVAGPGAAIVFVSLLVSLGPALSARDGHGRPGRWTATNIRCNKRGCDEVGTFLSADGSDRRTRIKMAGRQDLATGQAVPAVDAGGDEVYPPGGGGFWWHDLMGVIAAGLVSAVWLWSFPLRVVRQRSRGGGVRLSSPTQ
ncbi:hypothetical protein ACIPSA_20010 [Streptomyces sp. NPDC086549]|uniref:hypothetical protein n=1 Tax=Streptomyces sp. NPDC086549 TaxID=3365752 RepID=UPI0037FC23E8